MKTSFSFDEKSRAFHMHPEDELERHLMVHLNELCAKGARLQIREATNGGTEKKYIVEMRIDGKEPGTE